MDPNFVPNHARDIAALQDALTELQRRVDKQAIVIRALFALLSEGESPSEAVLAMWPARQSSAPSLPVLWR
jgi:hypothetical protein